MDMMFHAPWHSSPVQHRRMGLFLLLAILLHGMVLYYYNQQAEEVRPQLPDWINIKLVAGIDQSENKTPNKQTSELKRVPKPVEAVKPQPQSQQKTPQTSKAAEAEHFVKADSRPLEYENPKPFYPAAARRRGMEGTVLLQVEVNERGKVSFIELKKSSGYRLLDNAAISTVKQWQFIPAKDDNRVVVSRVEVPVRFKLEEF